MNARVQRLRSQAGNIVDCTGAAAAAAGRGRRRIPPGEPRNADGSPRNDFKISFRPRWSAIRTVAANEEFNVRCRLCRNSGVISERDL